MHLAEQRSFFFKQACSRFCVGIPKIWRSAILVFLYLAYIKSFTVVRANKYA